MRSWGLLGIFYGSFRWFKKNDDSGNFFRFMFFLGWIFVECFNRGEEDGVRTSVGLGFKQHLKLGGKKGRYFLCEGVIFVGSLGIG